MNAWDASSSFFHRASPWAISFLWMIACRNVFWAFVIRMRAWLELISSQLCCFLVSISCRTIRIVSGFPNSALVSPSSSENQWDTSDKWQEIVFGEANDLHICFSNDCGGSWVAGDDGHLAEVITSNQAADPSLTLNHHYSRRHYVECISWCSLWI